jgi:hypothetical protein
MFKSALEFHNRAIDKLVTRVEQQKDLLTVVQRVLPENLAEHTLHCMVHKATLLIYTDAAVWSSQLRFYQAAILTAISSLIQTPVKRIQTRLIKH